MPSEKWVKRAKQLGKLDDSDSPEVIQSCYDIFGEDFGEVERLIYQPKPEQLVLSGEIERRKRWKL